MAIAARVSKYGITLEQALWDVPLAVLNQLVIYDDLASGNQPRWRMDRHDAERSIGHYIEAEMTSRQRDGDKDHGNRE